MTGCSSSKPIMATLALLSFRVYMAAIVVEQAVENPRYMLPLEQVVRACIHKPHFST